MKKLLYSTSVYLTLALFFLLACNNKTKEVKQGDESVGIEDSISSELNEITDRLSFDQYGLFGQLVNSIALKDFYTYESDIEKFNNIDSLVLFTPSGEEDEIRYSLLGLACRLNNLEVVQDLVARKANIDIGSEDDYHALDAMYYAITGGNAEIVKVLIDKGSDLNALYTDTGMTPLVLAVLNKKYVMAEILIQYGANVDGIPDLYTDYLYNPLREAIYNNDVEMVKILLKHKANIHLKDADGNDAKTIAKNQEAEEILKLLEQVD